MNNDKTLHSEINKVITLLKAKKSIIAFTGAGISTESGIPDFRGPQGVWKKYRPIELSEFLQDPESRALYWQRKIDMYPQMKNAVPNKGHLALFELYKKNFLQYVITQNIDGLHQRAGMPDDRVIELHGSNTYIACLDCRKRYEWEDILPLFEKQSTSPKCDECGGWLKPATISFGQAILEYETNEAERIASAADAIIVIGSSLQVYPAVGIPVTTKMNGGSVVIINMEPTGQDEIADCLLHGPAGDILQAIAEGVDERAI